jgi:hypothetical protein
MSLLCPSGALERSFIPWNHGMWTANVKFLRFFFFKKKKIVETSGIQISEVPEKERQKVFGDILFFGIGPKK